MSADFALTAERLRDDLETFRQDLRRAYRSTGAQVSSTALKRTAAALAERGLVDLTGTDQLRQAIGDDMVADLTVEFQRLLTASGKAATRKTYEAALSNILKDFTVNVVVPIKQAGGRINPAAITAKHHSGMPSSAFLGHSFAPVDAPIVTCVRDTLHLLGIEVITGDRPRADTISEKVKGLIDVPTMFVGLYTRGEKITGKKIWTTSAWVIEEKAYAVAKRKKLLLLRETGIGTIGGLQGDYEYIDFDRTQLHRLVLKLLRVFKIQATGFAE